MPFDLFISYSRRDNHPRKPWDPRGWVTALRDEILADHRRFSTEPLRIFFDTEEIGSMDDWQHRILEALRQSRILLVCLSPDYFRSEFCRMEWEEYLRRQVHVLMGHDSVAPVYFVEVPGSGEEGNAASFAQWVDEIGPWLGGVMRPNFTDLRPWFPLGVEALREEAVRQRLAALGTSLWQRIQRARRAAAAPGNLRRLNPHFIGRRTELRRLHENLALGAVGVVTAVHGLGGQGKTELATAYAHGWADSYPAGLWILGAEGKREILPLLGELCGELQIALVAGPGETADQRGRRVLAELKRRALQAGQGDPDKGTACLVILDNVSDPLLLSEPQLAHLPREDWLRIVVTTRDGPERFPASRRKSLAFVPVDALTEDDAARLIEDHQPDGRWPDATAAADAADARAIARELGGYTLAIEGVAIYLGLYPDIRPADYLSRLRADGPQSVDTLPADADVAAQMQHREKQLRVVLDQTLTRLAPPERTALEYSALLPPDTVPWPWLRELAAREHPETLTPRPGYPDPWLALHRRLEGLRLLAPGDHPLVARMHRLLSAALRDRIMERPATDSPLAKLVDFLCDPQTPFAHDLPIEVFLSAWQLFARSESLATRLIRRMEDDEASALLPHLAEKWTELSYHLGNPVLEKWWLERWAGNAEPSPALAQRRAAWLHRKGDTQEACSILRECLESHFDDFDVSNQLLSYLTQTGRHEEAQAIAEHVVAAHAEILEKDPLRRAAFLHSKYFISHELEKNDEAIAASRFIREEYLRNHLTYDSLIATVNLGDALWATGKTDEAIELIGDTLSEGRRSGLAQVENIAAICLANVLSSLGSAREATKLYEQGVALSGSIDHRWDLIYGQAYQALHDLETTGHASGLDFPAIREAALGAGFEYLAALVDSHVCIGSFVTTMDADLLQQSIRRGITSPFPASRLYALSAMIRAQLVAGESPDAGRVSEWVRTLGSLQGIKGRPGVVTRLAEWLVRAGALGEGDALRVREWTERYVPESLAEYHRTRYSLPETSATAARRIGKGSIGRPLPVVRLRACDLNVCEARCCYDGVYLQDGEEATIREVVASAPEFFAELPHDFIVDGAWKDRISGRKTATRPWDYQAPDFPSHFERTRCVFCSDDHKCLLQVLAVQRGLHKWTYKPGACWMFPMRIVEGKPAPPAGPHEPDPHGLGDEYPGYTKFVPCGQHRDAGDPWEQTLADEIAFWRESQRERGRGD